MSAANERNPEVERETLPEARAPALVTPAFGRLLVVQAAIGLASSIFTLLPKVLAADFAATPREIGFIMAAFGFASLVAIPFVGRVVETLGHRRTIAVSALLLATSASAFAGVRGAGLAAVLLRGLQGVSWSLTFAAGMALVADLVPAARLAQGIGLFGASALAMNAVGPAIAEPLADHYGTRAIFAFATAAALLGAWLARRLPDGHVHAPAPTAAAAAAPGPAADGESRGRVYVAFVVGGLCWCSLFTFIAPFALARGVHVVRGFFVGYTAAALAVRLVGARLADRLGPARVSVWSSIAYGAVVAAAGLVGPTHLLALGVAFGVAHGAAFPALMALLLTGVPGARRPRVLALANGAMNLGISAVFALGLVAERLDFPAVFVATGSLNVAAALVLLPRRRRLAPVIS